MVTAAPIAIVEDDEAVRLSTAALLSSAGFDVVSFATGTEFLAADIEALQLVLLDIHMPPPDGIAVLETLSRSERSPPVLVLSGHGDVRLAVQAMKLGAIDFLEKPYEAESLIAQVEAALAPGFRQHRGVNPAAKALIDALTPRQREVLVGISTGQPSKAIAFELGLSIRTVEAYRAQLLERLGVASTAEAVRLGVLGGLDTFQQGAATSTSAGHSSKLH